MSGSGSLICASRVFFFHFLRFHLFMSTLYRTYRRPVLVCLLIVCAIIQVWYLYAMRNGGAELWGRDSSQMSHVEFARRQEQAAKYVLDWAERPLIGLAELSKETIGTLFADSCATIPSKAIAVSPSELPQDTVLAANSAFAELAKAYMTPAQADGIIAFNSRRGESLSKDIRSNIVAQLVGQNIFSQSDAASKSDKELLELVLSASGQKIAWSNIVDGTCCRTFYEVLIADASCLGESPAANYREAFSNSFFFTHMFSQSATWPCKDFCVTPSGNMICSG
jgi:hypothetical protein